MGQTPCKTDIRRGTIRGMYPNEHRPPSENVGSPRSKPSRRATWPGEGPPQISVVVSRIEPKWETLISNLCTPRAKTWGTAGRERWVAEPMVHCAGKQASPRTDRLRVQAVA